MAAKARLSCPVRCAAISPGPNLPILPQAWLSCPVRCAPAISPGLPIPPAVENNRPNLRGKNTELLMAKQVTKNEHSQINQFGVQFSPIRELKRCFRAISRAIRDNSRQLALIRDKAFCGCLPFSGHGLALRPVRRSASDLSSEALRAKDGSRKPAGRRRITSIDFAKQTQFAKTQNCPKPLIGNDL
jgi:hypothetical protein